MTPDANPDMPNTEQTEQQSGADTAAADVAASNAAPRATGLSIEEVPSEPANSTTDAAPTQTPKPLQKISLPVIPALTLAPSGLSRELVTLRGTGGVAPYELTAGRMLNNTWRRTSLFFTSAGAHEGATETAVNLATIMSRRTESALLVELQLTDPGLWQLLGQPPVKSGFEQALRGKATFEECLQHISGEKIDVLLLREPMSVLEAEHLSGALNDFLEWAEERFAWMIVDCPPVLGPAWTRWFDLNADPVVLVARREKTIKHQLRKAAKHLGDRLAGTVLSSAENGSSMPRVRPSKNGTVASNGRPGAPLPPPS